MKKFYNVPSSSHRFISSLSMLMLPLVLAGCATNPGSDKNTTSQLVVHTSSSQGSRLEGPPPSSSYPVAPTPSKRSRAGSPPPSSHAGPVALTASSTDNSTNNSTMLNFVNADLQGVLSALARFTGRNFVVDPRVKGQLTLVSEAPVNPDIAYAMLLSALRMQGFSVVDVDGVSRVVPEADAKLQGAVVGTASQPATVRGGELITRVFRLRYEDATNLVPILRPMIAPNNPINAYTGNNTLVITDYADNLDRIAQVIDGIDTPHSVNTDVVPIQYGVALDVAALAIQLLDEKTSGGGPMQTAIVADPRSNTVLLRASSPERLSRARDLVESIDTPETRAGNLHVVYLRNAQATRLAEVLRGALSGQSSDNSSGSGESLSKSLSEGINSSLLDVDAGTNDPLKSLGGSDSNDNNAMRSVAFTAGGATIQADPSTNTLIISAPPPLYRSLREVIDQLDQRRAQVLVESLIVEVNAENAAEFGIQWMLGGNDIQNGSSSFIGGANFGGTGINASGKTTIDALAEGLSLGVIKGTVNVLGSEVLNLSVLARAMESNGGANVLSTPNLMTLDNEEASIVVGRTVPFVTGQYTTSADGASNPFQTIKREDVGLSLRIRPQISEGGTVKMTLYQEVSSLDPMSTVKTGFITRKRALETNVLIDDGQIVVLGGLLEDRVSDTTSSVPLLGDIPLLGNLFRYDSRSRSKTNLMIFLRPHIVRNAQDGAAVTLDRYNYMRAAQSRLPTRSTWFSPSEEMTPLPDIQRNPGTGLLDLRDTENSPPAPAAWPDASGNL